MLHSTILYVVLYYIEYYRTEYLSHGRRNRGATGARAPLIFELTYRVVQKVPSKSVALPTSLSLIPRIL